MSHSLKNVLFIGASGSIGGPVFKSLKSAGFTLTILSRTSSKATFDEDVKVIKRDYSDKNLAEAFEGQDVVVSFINGAAILDQINFIDLAANAGVKRFIPSEFGSDTLNSKAQDLVFFYKQKFAVIEHARAVAERSPHFTWTAIATGPIFDWCLESGFLGFDLKNNTALIYDSGDQRISATNIGTTAKAIESILKSPTATSNRYIYISSFTISQNDVLKSLERVSSKRWTVNNASTVEGEREGRAKLEKGDFSGIRGLLARLMWGGDTGGNFASSPQGLANALLKLSEEDLNETVKYITMNKIASTGFETS